jgi:AraC-like DNA-binding protein
MIKTAESLAKTTALDLGYDVLSDALRSMRIQGNLLLNDEYASPWAIAIPDSPTLATLLQVSTSVRVIAFHLVKRGYVEIALDDGCQISLEAGEIGICFGGVAHSIFQGDRYRALPVENLLLGRANPFRPRDHAPRPAALTCGVFLLHHTELNPLFASLPSLLHLHRSSSNLVAITELLLRNVDGQLLGNSYTTERLLELLCAEAVRSFVATNPNQGWFSSLQDPIVGKAIALMHAQPQITWTVEQLAAKVALSPSRFAARFATTIQESPMAYLAKWRMNLASRLLIQTSQGVEEIAHVVGYTSLPAFNRAFKKHLGLPPVAWRHNKSMKRTVERSW